MTREDKSKYTDKQKRQAQHIEEGYEKRGDSEATAEKRAWATVNNMASTLLTQIDRCLQESDHGYTQPNFGLDG